MASYSNGLSSSDYYGNNQARKDEWLAENKALYDQLMKTYGQEYGAAQTADDADYAKTLASLASEYAAAQQYNDAATSAAVAAQEPYVSAGSAATKNIEQWLGSHGDFANEYRDISRQATSTDAYQHNLSRGIDAVGDQGARAGSFFSGATQLASKNFENDLMSEAVSKLWDSAQDYNSSYLSGLSGLADRGQSAAGTVATAYRDGANTNASLSSNYGNNTNAAYGTNSTARTNNVNGLTTAQGNAANTYQTENANARSSAADTEKTGYVAETEADAQGGK